ncbi:hypothetical protein ABGB07_44840 [Micromonosporaceae bacterium B7E4]
MSGTTPVYGLPYQTNDDPPDGPALGEDLALAVESELQRIDGDIADLSAAPGEAYQGANDTSAAGTYTSGTTHGLSFTAPASGRVEVTFSGWVGSSAVIASTTTPRTYMSDHVRSGGVIGSGTDVLAADDDRAIPYFVANTTAGFKYIFGQLTHLVTGLTPGNSYNVVTVFRENGGGASAAINKRRLVVKPA